MSSVTRYGDLLPFWQFSKAFGDIFFCQKSPVHKSFDVNILGFGKFFYVLWWQIWQFLPNCWRLFGLNTWSHWWWAFIQDKLADKQVITHCQYSVAQMCHGKNACPLEWAPPSFVTSWVKVSSQHMYQDLGFLDSDCIFTTNFYVNCLKSRWRNLRKLSHQ